MENSRLFVGNLAWKARKQDIWDAFAKAGEVVDVVIMFDRETGKSRGFAFITMASDEDAQKAIKMYDGQDYDGRSLKVNVARPREEGNAPRYERSHSDRDRSDRSERSHHRS